MRRVDFGGRRQHVVYELVVRADRRAAAPSASSERPARRGPPRSTSAGGRPSTTPTARRTRHARRGCRPGGRACRAAGRRRSSGPRPRSAGVRSRPCRRGARTLRRSQRPACGMRSFSIRSKTNPVDEGATENGPRLDCRWAGDGIGEPAGVTGGIARGAAHVLVRRLNPIVVRSCRRSRRSEACCCAAHTPIEQHEKAAIANAADRPDAMLEPSLRCRPV